MQHIRELIKVFVLAYRKKLFVFDKGMAFEYCRCFLLLCGSVTKRRIKAPSSRICFLPPFSTNGVKSVFHLGCEAHVTLEMTSYCIGNK